MRRKETRTRWSRTYSDACARRSAILAGVATMLAGVYRHEREATLLAAAGRSTREIAGHLGKSEVATRTLLCRGRVRVRNGLAALDGAQSGSQATRAVTLPPSLSRTAVSGPGSAWRFGLHGELVEDDPLRRLAGPLERRLEREQVVDREGQRRLVGLVGDAVLVQLAGRRPRLDVGAEDVPVRPASGRLRAGDAGNPPRALANVGQSRGQPPARVRRRSTAAHAFGRAASRGPGHGRESAGPRLAGRRARASPGLPASR